MGRRVPSMAAVRDVVEPQQRLRWADMELDIPAAEKVARALAADYGTRARRSPELIWADPRLVESEGDQFRVQDGQACLKQYSAECWDAITSEPLPADLSSAALQEEPSFMNSLKVWHVVPVAQCLIRTGRKPIEGTCVDVNRGDRVRPVIRCRWVAKGFATYKSAEFFAATPPLEALRMMISHAASGRTHGFNGRKLLAIDARKAHLHAMAGREAFLDLFPEQNIPGMCARLRRCFDSNRDAPARWEVFLAEQLTFMGFIRGKASACC